MLSGLNRRLDSSCAIFDDFCLLRKNLELSEIVYSVAQSVIRGCNLFSCGINLNDVDFE